MSMNPVSFTPAGQTFDEQQNGPLVAHSDGVI